jgi:polar amino acid transport system substrate-binding protein
MLMMLPLAPAGSNARELRVATRMLPPIVLTDGSGRLSGFAIDLWTSISDRMGTATRYQVTPDVGVLLKEVQSGRADVGVEAVSITAEREKEFDFSLPFLNAGLQIMVRSQTPGPHPRPSIYLLGLTAVEAILAWLATAALTILVLAHAVWVHQRRERSEIDSTENYWSGIRRAMSRVTGTVMAWGARDPRHWLARAIATCWALAGLVFVSIYTSHVATNFARQQVEPEITGLGDLPGRRVAATRGSTAAMYLRDIKAQVYEVTAINAAYNSLLDQRVDAIVFDAPVLLYYAANAGKGRVRMVGPLFQREDYGIVVAQNSALRKQINGALLELREDGTYQKIYDKWFTFECPGCIHDDEPR